LQFSRYKFSSRTQGLYSALKNRTGLSNNILARYALCLSLKDPSIPNPDEFDENGSEILPSVLFGEHENIYTALMLDRLNTDNLDSELYFHKMTRAHLNRGATILFSRVHELTDFIDMIKQERK
jgi:DNA sulfur modification protein DndE